MCCFRLLDRLVNLQINALQSLYNSRLRKRKYLYRSFRLLYRRSRTELRLLPKARRLWTKERRRHWWTSLLDRAIAIVVHRRRRTSKTVPIEGGGLCLRVKCVQNGSLRSKGSHGQRVTNAMILRKEVHQTDVFKSNEYLIKVLPLQGHISEVYLHL